MSAAGEAEDARASKALARWLALFAIAGLISACAPPPAAVRPADAPAGRGFTSRLHRRSRLSDRAAAERAEQPRAALSELPGTPRPRPKRSPQSAPPTTPPEPDEQQLRLLADLQRYGHSVPMTFAVSRTT